MKPTQHIMITTIAFLSLLFIVPLPISVLLWAIVLTLGVDAFDHIRILFFVKNPVCDCARKLVCEGKFIEAYKYYYKNRFIGNYTLLHNVGVLFFVWLMTIVFASPILLLGVVLHFACDHTYLFCMGRLSLWWRNDVEGFSLQM